VAQPLDDLVGDGARLTGIGAGEDDEEVGVADRVGHVEDDGVLGFFLGRVAHDLASQLPCGLELGVECYC
jgi:hypothetical protein